MNLAAKLFSNEELIEIYQFEIKRLKEYFETPSPTLIADLEKKIEELKLKLKN